QLPTPHLAPVPPPAPPRPASVPGALKPEAAAHAALVVAAFDSLGARPGGAGAGGVQGLIDSEEGLLCLSDAVRLLTPRGGLTGAHHGRRSEDGTSAAPQRAVS
ncbi:hypothetical protein ACFW7J_23915, partial [Streptomyces sp. NPDC059525]